MAESLSQPLDRFKEREIEILRLMAAGSTNKAIAEQLFITTETVRWYNKQIYSKLGTSRRTEAISLARTLGLLGAPAGAGVPLARHTLPATTGPFVGRDQELKEFAALVQRPELRLVSLIGTGGLGKSRLALELGHLVAGSFNDGAVFIDLTAVKRPGAVAEAALASLGVSAAGKQQPRDALFDYCRSKNLLLIFDSFEHVLPEAQLLAALAVNAPAVTMLVTSRVQLNLQLETALFLSPIIENGRELFIEVAAMMRPGIRVKRGEYRDVDDIVRLVGGLPLALLLGASWIDTLSPAEIAAEIRANLDVLTAQLGDIPERQRSIRAVIDPTWQRLGAAEQQAFARASIFRGGFTRDALQQVSGISLQQFRVLQQHSLLNRGHGRRFDLHPLLRQYALEKLLNTGEFDAARQAHFAYSLAFSEEQQQLRLSGDYLPALDALSMEHDNLRAALDWALDGNDALGGSRLALNLYELWNARSYFREARAYIGMALAHDIPDNMRGRLCGRLGFLEWLLGQSSTAVDRLTEALAIAQRVGDVETEAGSLRLLCFVRPDLTRAESLAMCERALAASQTTGNQRLTAHILNTKANLLLQGDADVTQALACFGQARSIFAAEGDPRGLSKVLYNQGLALELLGKPGAAMTLVEESLALKQQLGDRAGAARCMSVIAAHIMVDGSQTRAEELIASSLKLCEETGDRSQTAFNLLLTGRLQAAGDDFSAAEDTVRRALTICRELKADEWIAELHGLLTLTQLRQERIKPAQTYLVNCLEMAHQIGDVNLTWFALLAGAAFLQAGGDAGACARIVSTLERTAAVEHAFAARHFLAPLAAQLETHAVTGSVENQAETLDVLLVALRSQIDVGA